MHLGKHGTLEWLPGKGLGLSADCAPDAVLGNLPLVYPFIVNDPGEGTQAKRRGHATIIDHLIPPMARADTYGDLAKLEQLLDEYATVSALDPAKLPVLRTQIWELIQAAELHHDLELAAAPGDGRVRQLRAARGRLPVRGQGRADPRRAAHPRPRPGRGAAGGDRAGRAPRDAGLGRAHRRAARAAQRAGALGRPGRGNSPQRKPWRPHHRPRRADPRGRRAGPDRRRRGRPAGVGRAPAGDHDGRSRLAPGPGRAGVHQGARRGTGGRGGGAGVRGPGGGAAAGPDHRRGDPPAGRAGRPVRPGRAVRVAHPRAGQRAAHRPQLLLRGPEGHPVPQRLGDRGRAGRLAAGPAPGRHRELPPRGRADRVGHVGHAHPGRRHRRSARADRLRAHLGRRLPAGHRFHRGGVGENRAPADRCHGPDLRVLPGRVPARDRAAGRRDQRGGRAGRAAGGQLPAGAHRRGAGRARRPAGGPPPGSSGPSPAGTGRACCR